MRFLFLLFHLNGYLDLLLEGKICFIFHDTASPNAPQYYVICDRGSATDAHICHRCSHISPKHGVNFPQMWGNVPKTWGHFL